jgi:hypothetical protein
MAPISPTVDDMVDELVADYCGTADDYYAALAEIIQAFESKVADLKEEVAENAIETDPEEDDEPEE